MSKSPFFSTPSRIRGRHRLFVSEAIRLDVRDLGAILDGAEAAVTLAYPGSRLMLRAERSGEDTLFVTGGPSSETIGLVQVSAGRSRVRTVLRCPACSRAARHLFLPYGEGRLKCRSCHRLRYRERAGADPLERLEETYARVGAALKHLRWLRGLGARPETVDPEYDLRWLKSELRRLEELVDRVAPTGTS